VVTPNISSAVLPGQPIVVTVPESRPAVGDKSDTSIVSAKDGPA
jgi:hypothetical protein